MIGLAIGAFVVTVALTPVMATLARHFQIVDHPGPLKVHARPVPYLGGVAVFLGMALGLLAAQRPVLLLPLGLSLVLGLLDDVYGIAPSSRLVSEIGIGIVVAAAIPSRVDSPWGSVLTVMVVVGLINAMNLIDGLDGLAAGVGLAAAVGFAAILGESGQAFAVTVAGALTGFLLFNCPPARIYLGDAGSYVLGTALVILLLIAWQPGGSRIAAVGAPALVAVPLTDTFATLLRRVRARRPLFEGDRGHSYDKLVDRGWSSARAAVACVATQAAIAAAVVAASSNLALEVATVAVSLVALLALIFVVGFIAPTYRKTA